MSERPLLMIPGPIEVSPEVLRAFSRPPPGHGQPFVVKAFGASLGWMREVWRAGEGAQPFMVAGSGTLAMDMAAVNLLDPGDEALLVDTGYFADRMRLVLEHRGVKVHTVVSPPGERPEPEEVAAAAVFLASDDAAAIAGRSLVIDGGFQNGLLQPVERMLS